MQNKEYVKRIYYFFDTLNEASAYHLPKIHLQKNVHFVY